MDRVISKDHEKKLAAIARVLRKTSAPKKGYKSEATRLAIDVLYELVVNVDQERGIVLKVLPNKQYIVRLIARAAE